MVFTWPPQIAGRMDIPQQMVIQIPKEGEASVMEAVTEEQEGEEDD